MSERTDEQSWGVPLDRRRFCFLFSPDGDSPADAMCCSYLCRTLPPQSNLWKNSSRACSKERYSPWRPPAGASSGSAVSSPLPRSSPILTDLHPAETSENQNSVRKLDIGSELRWRAGSKTTEEKPSPALSPRRPSETKAAGRDLPRNFFNRFYFIVKNFLLSLFKIKLAVRILPGQVLAVTFR